MRVLLILWLAIGLAPGLGEVAESVVHLAAAGELAHSDPGHGERSGPGDEHGCGATQHLCGCCVSQVVAAPPRAQVVALAGPAAGRMPPGASLASLHEPSPLLRPPIAS